MSFKGLTTVHAINEISTQTDNVWSTIRTQSIVVTETITQRNTLNVLLLSYKAVTNLLVKLAGES